VARDLVRRGHAVSAYEPHDAWSRTNLLVEAGEQALEDFAGAYPDLRGVSVSYGPAVDLPAILAGADVVLVHEWNDPALVRRIGAHRQDGGRYALFFHDTHHRAVSAPDAIAAFDLRGYDGVLAFGSCLRDIYLERGWAQQVWVWHEAADVSLFRPRAAPPAGDLVWIGNWGDDERTAELTEMLIEPVKALGLSATVYGVRYPPAALRALADAGITYRGWLPNFHVPTTFAGFRVTVHIPRRAYRQELPGIPTIRPFEALACGLPLISAPWNDQDGLFSPGSDYLVARDGAEMCDHLRAVLGDPALAAALSARGRQTIAARHTCAHRVDQLLAIVASLGKGRREPRSDNDLFDVQVAP
jgi:spore maturation protein CgeB